MSASREMERASKRKIMNASLLSFLPEEILLEILTKLPVKSLLQLKCVCKSAYSLFTDPSFIELHHNMCSTLPGKTSILMHFPTRTNMTRHVYYTINMSEGSQGKLRSCYVPYLERKLFRKHHLRSSANGLVCLYKKPHDVIVCNLSTRQHISLPEAHEVHGSKSPKSGCALLGFDPVLKTFKVLKSVQYLDSRDVQKHWIFTLGVDKSWREINIDSYFPHCSFDSFYSHSSSVYVEGVIYSLNWHRGNIDDFSRCDDIAAFDVRTENLSMISFPSGLPRQDFYSSDVFSRSGLVGLEGRLAIIQVCPNNDNKMKIWTLKNSMQWENKWTMPIPLEGRKLLGRADLLRFASTHAGEIVLVTLGRKTISVLIYGLRMQVWRVFKVRGHFPTDNEAWKNVMHIVPESIFSLI
ncbi:unnamed protein product [Cuscuta epithymum]|uniref:F-box domain-containing protein n=1 Tax=Cuscuta epithymum TaxID=186058 RepID=A0AAV0CY45_9ASTE|nr:unnamed protein product [Cuscuta epithymum]